MTRTPSVEILYFDGCPNWRETVALVERVAADVGVDPELELVRVEDAEAAEQESFLGSPTVRVDGRDVEPGADERKEFVLSCRVYRTDRGFSGQPEPEWLRTALGRSSAR